MFTDNMKLKLTSIGGEKINTGTVFTGVYVTDLRTIPGKSCLSMKMIIS